MRPAHARRLSVSMQPPASPPSFVSTTGGALPGPAVALYTPDQIALAALVGTALGGSVVLALNERRLGRPHDAIVTVLLCVFATWVTVSIAFAVPVASTPLALLTVMVLRAIAQQRQRALVDAHIAAGGKRASSWAAAGIGLLSAVVVLVPLVLVFVMVARLSS